MCGTARQDVQDLAHVLLDHRIPGIAGEGVGSLQTGFGPDVLNHCAGADREHTRPVESLVAVVCPCFLQPPGLLVEHALHHAEFIMRGGRLQPASDFPDGAAGAVGAAGIVAGTEVGTVPGLLAPDGAEADERHRACARVSEAPVGALDRESAVADGGHDLARVDAVVGVVVVDDIAVVVLDVVPVGVHARRAPAAATAAAEDDDGGVVVADQVRGSQVQVLDPREIALRIRRTCVTGHAAAALRSAHDDPAALDGHVGKMRAAAHVDRCAERAGRIGDRSVQGRIGDLAARGSHGGVSGDAEGREPADPVHVSRADADAAADVLVVVAVRVVAEVRVVPAGNKAVAHVLAVSGAGGSIDRGFPRLAGWGFAVCGGIGGLHAGRDGGRVQPEIVVGGGVIVERHVRRFDAHVGDDGIVVDAQHRAAVADPRFGDAAAVLDKHAGVVQRGHGDIAHGRAGIDPHGAAVPDLDVVAAGELAELDVRALRCGREEAAHIGAVAVAVPRFIP